MKKRIGESSKQRWSDPEYKKRVSLKLKGHNPSEEVREKISESNKRTKALHPRTAEQTEKWRKSRSNTVVTPWNKGKVGLVHHNEEVRQKIGDRFRGIHLSEEHKRKISETRKLTFHQSEESKEKLRQAALNMTQEQKDKISASVKQRWEEGAYVNRRKRAPMSEEQRKKLSDAGKRSRPKGSFHHSAESKQKMSESHLGKLPTNSHSIVCVETAQKFNSIAEASRLLKISNISDVVDDPNHTRGGYHFISMIGDEGVENV